VTWTATGGIAHTVTSGTGSAAADAGKLFDMPLPANGSVKFTFQTPGTYPYFCRIHEAMNMRGTVTVVAATTDAGVTPDARGTGGTGGTSGTGGTGGSGGYGGY